MASTRVLILTPWVPYPVTGACQQDRFNGFLQMQKMGYQVHVIARIHPFQQRQDIEAAFAKVGVPLTLVAHTRYLWLLLLKRLPRIARTPSLIDGAALEYTDPVYEAAVHHAMRTF